MSVFKLAAGRHLGFFGSRISRHQKSQPTRIYPYPNTKFGENISKRSRVITIYVFQNAKRLVIVMKVMVPMLNFVWSNRVCK